LTKNKKNSIAKDSAIRRGRIYQSPEYKYMKGPEKAKRKYI
jgi:hypothetical protein